MHSACVHRGYSLLIKRNEFSLFGNWTKIYIRLYEFKIYIIQLFHSVFLLFIYLYLENHCLFLRLVFLSIIVQQLLIKYQLWVLQRLRKRYTSASTIWNYSIFLRFILCVHSDARVWLNLHCLAFEFLSKYFANFTAMFIIDTI